MLEYIWLKNFQSHIDTRIDLSNATAITGLSMSGKTVIIRGFEWLRTNRPSGLHFNYRHHKKHKPTSVEVGVNKHIVRLTKSKKALDEEGNKAIYYIRYPDGTEIEEKTFGTSVPESITKALNVSNISIQRQLDAYLLVISSSGEIARTINKITGIDIGDNWIKEIKKTINSLNMQESNIKINIQTMKNNLKKYDGIDKASNIIAEAKAIQSIYKEKINQRLEMVDLINTHTNADSKRLIWEERLKKLNGSLQQIESIDSKISLKKQQVDMTNNLILMAKAKKESKSTLDFLQPKLERLIKIENRILFQKEIEKIIDQSIAASNLFDETSLAIDGAIMELKAKLKEIGQCYTCGSELTDKIISGMVS